MNEAFSELYKKGIAVGETDIHSDTISFRFKDELFSFNTSDLDPSVYGHNGYFYEAKVKELRKEHKKLAREKH